jgi:putative tryptophan/tyrosine transport system substrate-binding protein
MRRRDFIALVAAGALAWPLVARTQPSERMRRVGILLGIGEDKEGLLRVATFRQQMRELGWIEGKNIRFDVNWTSGDAERLRVYADEMVRSNPDVILGSSSPVILALKKISRSIPIVFTVVTDPVGAGMLANPARPEGNLTGFTNFDVSMGGKWVEILKELAPSITRLGIFYDPANAPDISPYYKRSLDTAAQLLEVNLVDAPVRTADDIERAVATLAGRPNAGMVVLPDNTTVRYRELLARLASKHRVPAIYPYRYFARSGGLASYGVDTVDLFRRGATYVDRILNGWKLAELPVQSPTKFEFVLNLEAAKDLQLEIPPSLMARVDEVIE